ncbi:MAG: hypothetical protein RLZZ297_1408 [Chloroflexota bacterium]
MTPPEPGTPLSLRWRRGRRNLLIGIGAGSTLLAVGWILGKGPARRALSDFAEGSETALSRGVPSATPLQWVRIDADNHLVVSIQKIDMGQGISTALAQIAADEFGIPWERVRVETVATNSPIDDANATGNSESVVAHFLPLRNAAATLREMLRASAAATFGLALSAVSVTETGVTSSAGDNWTYAQVVGRHRGDWQVPATAPLLKSADAFVHIGAPRQRLDIPAIVTGTREYAYDVRRPGMLWGAVARPPSFGATIRSVDTGDAAQADGVVSVLADTTFVGVAAATKAHALAALQRITITWDEPHAALDHDAIDAAMAIDLAQGVHIQDEGDVEAAFAADGVTVYTSEYHTPMAAHAHLEPQAAVVDVQTDRVDAWVSTQAPVGTGRRIADLLGRAVTDVTVHPVALGGGFGRRLDETLGLDAARLSAASGKPVAVHWTRAQEFQNGYVRPPTAHRLRATLAADGTITAIHHHQVSGDVLLPTLPAAVGTIVGWDIGATRGARLLYTGAVARRTTAQRVLLPVPTGFWRGLGLLANGFAIESFIDQLAVAADRDPVAFRLAALPETPFGDRMRGVLRAVADQAGWGGTPPNGRAWGVACSADAGTCVAQIAEVSVTDGAIRVHRVWAAVDCGTVVNPEGVIAQTEGGIIMGISSTLHEALRVVSGRFASDNFDRYPLLRNSAAPDIDVVIVASTAAPGGMGEPPMGPIAAAVANALYRLTGSRCTTLPLTLS